MFIEWRELFHGRVAPGLYVAYSQGFLLLTGVFLLAVVAVCFVRNERAAESGPAH